MLFDILNIVSFLAVFIIATALSYRFVMFVLTLLFGNIYKIETIDKDGKQVVIRKRITTDAELDEFILAHCGKRKDSNVEC